MVYLNEVAEERLTAATFEELAMPLFDQLYNFAHWLTQDRTEAEDLVQETYVKASAGIFVISIRHKLPRLDVSHLAQHLPHIAHRTEGNRHRIARC